MARQNKDARSVAFTKMTLLSQAVINVLLLKSQPIGVPRFSYEAHCCRTRGPERRTAAYTWMYKRESPIGLGGRQHGSAARCVIR